MCILCCWTKSSQEYKIYKIAYSNKTIHREDNLGQKEDLNYIYVMSLL